MEVWVSKSYNKVLVKSELKKWAENTSKHLYHNVVQDWVNSRFPCCWDKQIPLFLEVTNDGIKITDSMDCVICMEDRNILWKCLPCGHKFHKDCIKKWLYKNPTCPLCRRKCSLFRY